MGFFKDFKEDLSLAVNELLPDDQANQEETAEQMVNTLDTDTDTAMEASDTEKMKEWLDGLDDTELDFDSDEAKNEEISNGTNEDKNEIELENVENEEGGSMDDNVDLELLDALNGDGTADAEEREEEHTLRVASISNEDEVTVISKGTTINGSITSDGALDIMGNVTGDVECQGKLSITGKLTGNASASEVFINTERIEGNIISEGSVKIGLGTVLIGDITGTSGVIAGAVRGEIDINGPLVIDSTAIIKGNINTKSVQINNGAIIDGFCSLSYSDVNIDNIFE
ncbi:MAG: polymer-forming cytoskeletal protein [Clostridiales bacterium]|nr:polymer-forming cytoskeletal protein [Clostridiales bacterium]